MSIKSDGKDIVSFGPDNNSFGNGSIGNIDDFKSMGSIGNRSFISANSLDYRPMDSLQSTGTVRSLNDNASNAALISGSIISSAVESSTAQQGGANNSPGLLAGIADYFPAVSLFVADNTAEDTNAARLKSLVVSDKVSAGSQKSPGTVKSVEMPDTSYDFTALKPNKETLFGGNNSINLGNNSINGFGNNSIISHHNSMMQRK